MPPLSHVFGGGWEPHTQAALAAVAAHVKPGMSFAEIGAGSGILSVAAKRLGASQCYATELNPDALKAATQVFKANEVEVTLIDGTFVDAYVDVAVISISSQFIDDHRDQIKADTVIVVHDDTSVEVLAKHERPARRQAPEPPVALTLDALHARILELEALVKKGGIA